MGNVSSRPEDKGAALYLRDQNRCTPRFPLAHALSHAAVHSICIANMLSSNHFLPHSHEPSKAQLHSRFP